MKIQKLIKLVTSSFILTMLLIGAGGYCGFKFYRNKTACAFSVDRGGGTGIAGHDMYEKCKKIPYDDRMKEHWMIIIQYEQDYDHLLSLMRTNPNLHPTYVKELREKEKRINKYKRYPHPTQSELDNIPYSAIE